jgi:formiminoglutamase
MKLPLLVSLPHAGLHVPQEARPYCRLSLEEIVADGDEGAAEIYALQEEVCQFVTTDVARAIVDLNRADNDFRADGVIKTHTCWNIPVYDPFPPQHAIAHLLDRYYRPYHHRIGTPHAAVRLGADCHTMAAVGPPIGPDTASPRPHVCLGDGNGTTMPPDWMRVLTDCFRKAFAGEVTVNTPFSGGYITRYHGRNHPWVQIELSRAPFLSNQEKQIRVLGALAEFCERVF